MMRHKIILFLTAALLSGFFSLPACGGDRITLSLTKAIEVANDSSLTAFKNRNL